MRAAPPLLREPVIVRLRPPAALRFRLAPARALLRRLVAAARFVFFLPRGGILLLRELGSQSAAGEANPLPAFVHETGHENTGQMASTFNDLPMRDRERVVFRVAVGHRRVTRVDANLNLAHHRAVPWRVYTRSFEVQ